MRHDRVKPYHDKVTEGWTNHVYPVNKGNMKRWPRGLKVRNKGMIHVSVYEPRLVKPIEPRNIATKIKNTLPVPEQKAPPRSRSYATQPSVRGLCPRSLLLLTPSRVENYKL